MSTCQILVVEDDTRIQELLHYNLTRAGFSVVSAYSAEEALSFLSQRPIDIVILDLMLPGMDGLTFCRRLKSQPDTANIPVIMLTARGEDQDIVTGLETGADDYIPKPFSPKVLIARIRAVLRRKTPDKEQDEECYSVGEITIDRSRREVRVRDRSIQLTRTEFEILDILASRAGRVLSRTEIAELVHGEPFVTTDRAVDVHIASLRKKLGEAGKMVETVRGVGYRIQPHQASQPSQVEP